MKALDLVTVLIMVSCGVAMAQQPVVQGQKRLNTDLSKYQTFGWAQMDTTRQDKDGIRILSYRELGKLDPSTAMTDENQPGGMGKNDMDMNKKSRKDMEPTRERDKTAMRNDRRSGYYRYHRGQNKSGMNMSGNERDSLYYIYAYDVIVPSSNKMMNSSIKQNIEAELEGRGYEKSMSSPDLLITYRVLEKPAEVRGFLGEPEEIMGGEEVRTYDDTTTYNLEPGTLMIGLIDAKSSESVWEGYASGLQQGSEFTRNDKTIKEAIHQIFQQFDYTSKDKARK